MASDWSVTFDAGDPHALARFWSVALGYVAEEGYDFKDGASLVDPTDERPPISFLKVPEPKTVKNRCHIDIRPAEGVDDPDRRDGLIRSLVADLVAAGGSITTQSSWDGHIEGVQMADPEGNEFCIA